MHVGIVIPLKSKKISRDWQVTCQSLHATLSSIENQTKPIATSNSLRPHTKEMYIDKGIFDFNTNRMQQE